MPPESPAQSYLVLFPLQNLILRFTDLSVKDIEHIVGLR